MSKNFPIIFHGQKKLLTIFLQFPNLGLGNNNVDDASSTTTRKKFFGPGRWKRSSTLFVGEGMFEHVLYYTPNFSPSDNHVKKFSGNFSRTKNFANNFSTISKI
jgi:hemolysin activation/secretion protein